MNDSISNLHNEIDDAFPEAEILTAKLGLKRPEEELKYFAADVIAAHYKGQHQAGLACACQSFMNARLLHAEQDMTPEKVLLGDYYAGLIAGFDLPANVHEILGLFADFIAEDIKTLDQGTDRKLTLARFGTLFRKIAEVAYE